MSKQLKGITLDEDAGTISTSTYELNPTWTKDGLNLVVQPGSPLGSAPDGTYDGLSGQNIRVRTVISTEQRASGLTRILVKTTCMQAREPATPDPSCCCTKPAGDTVATIHTVLSVPSEIVDKVKRLLVTQEPSIVAAAINTHGVALANVKDAERSQAHLLYDTFMRAIAGTAQVDESNSETYLPSWNPMH